MSKICLQIRASVSRIRRNHLDWGMMLHHLPEHLIEGYAIMDFSCCDFHIQYKAMIIADSVLVGGL